MNKTLHNIPLTQIRETINPNHSRQLSQQNSISFIDPRPNPSNLYMGHVRKRQCTYPPPTWIEPINLRGWNND